MQHRACGNDFEVGFQTVVLVGCHDSSAHTIGAEIEGVVYRLFRQFSRDDETDRAATEYSISRVPPVEGSPWIFAALHFRVRVCHDRVNATLHRVDLEPWVTVVTEISTPSNSLLCRRLWAIVRFGFPDGDSNSPTSRELSVSSSESGRT